MGLPLLEEYDKEFAAKNLFRAESEDKRFAKYKYSPIAVFRGYWNAVTVNARGHVFDRTTGKCVLRPWAKFFNYSELYSDDGEPTTICKAYTAIEGATPPKFTGKFRAMDKLDGSLIIAGFIPGYGTLVTSSGQFVSLQAEWSRKWLNKNLPPEAMQPGLTYMFEMISKENVLVVKYDFQACVLLGIIDNETGEELPYGEIKAFADKYGLMTPEVIEFASFDQARKYAVKLPKTKEGLVVTFDNGFKVKLKGDEFLKLHRAYHRLTPKNVLEKYKPELLDYQPGFLEEIPEELVEFRDFALDAKRVIENGLQAAIDFAKDQKEKGSDRKQAFTSAQAQFKDMDWIGGKMPMAAMAIFSHLLKGHEIDQDIKKKNAALLLTCMMQTANQRMKVKSFDDDE